jgi:hypothetical protein
VFDTLVYNLAANLLIIFFLFIECFDYDFLVIGNYQDDIINVIKSFIQNIFTMDIPDGSGADDYDSDEDKVEKIITNLEASQEDLESLGTDLATVGKEMKEESLSRTSLKRPREDDSDDEVQSYKAQRVEPSDDSNQGRLKILSYKDKDIAALGKEVKNNMEDLGKIYDKTNSEIVKETIKEFCESNDIIVNDITSNNKPKKP